jgi:hypothetical protein
VKTTLDVNHLDELLVGRLPGVAGWQRTTRRFAPGVPRLAADGVAAAVSRLENVDFVHRPIRHRHTL